MTPDAAPAARSVMSSGDVSRALRRVAHEILERNKGASDLVLVGIPSRGVPLAHRLADVIAEVEGTSVPVGALDITMHRDDLRHQPTRPVGPTSMPPGGIDGKVVVLVDDVLYSGRTIRADHVGKNLPTSSTERVHVRLRETDGQDDTVGISGGER